MVKSDKSSSPVKAIGAVVLGAIVGATVGVLLAPDKGSETRSKLVNSAKGMADEVTQKVKDKANALRAKADKMEGIVKDKVDEVASDVKDKAEELKETAKDKAHDWSNNVKQKMDGVKA